MGTKISLATEEFRGMNFGFNAKAGHFLTEDSLRAPEEMAELGINWVCVMASVAQDTFASTKVYHDYEWTVTDYELENIINRFHEQGIKVMLKLINLPLDSSWMGAINFPKPGIQIEGVQIDYWAQWFRSFTNCLIHYGRIVERSGAEIFCLSGELAGTQERNLEWRQAVTAVREVYSGAVTYEACFHPGLENVPSREYQEWYRELDFLVLSKYPTASIKAGTGKDEMIAYLREKEMPQLRKHAELLNGQILFAECGCRSVKGGAVKPAGIKNEYGDIFDGLEQRNYFEALETVFRPEPWWRGMFWWKWDETQNRPQYHGDPKGDCGFTVKGKPVAKAMQDYYRNGAR
jgi:hypothetical protein